mgnify:CR=1 FL=1
MINKAIIHQETTIREALNLINELSGKTLFIVDESNKAIGSVTDGDIRRGLLKGLSLESKIKDVMSLGFKFLTENDYSPKRIKELKAANILFVPLLASDGTIKEILNLSSLKSMLPLEAIIMAGGKGLRLAPLTDQTPKPLLKIGDKPIIEYNIDRLISFGIKKIYISVNYLKDQIMDYFGDGSQKGIVIEYIEESEITGTLGSATYVADFGTNDILVMNSDLLTNVDFEDLYQTYMENEAEMVVASVPYEVTVPYGILETEQNNITSLQEKPTFLYYSNAGIYIINKQCIRDIPQREFYNATDLIEKLIEENRKVVNFPIVDYWLDIGKPKDFEKAQFDIKHLKL